MIEIDEIRSYISEELEVDYIHTKKDMKISDIIEISEVHEDDRLHFILNFLDHYKVYAKERDSEYNYSHILKGNFRIFLIPFVWLLNVLKHDHVEYNHITVDDMHQMANSKQWIYPASAVCHP